MTARPLFLNGFMASGKTSVGRLVAERAGLPFLDLDQTLEGRSGRSVAELFKERGEAEFRRLERELLGEVLADPAPRVIALGGGALLNRELRLQAIDQAVVICLEARTEELVRRATAASTTRPLFHGATRERLVDLLDLRRPAYREAHALVNTDGKAIEQVADEVLAIWRRDPLGVAAGDDSYAIEIGSDFAPARLPELVAGAPTVVLVSDVMVDALYGTVAAEAIAKAGCQVIRCSFAAGEEHKQLEVLRLVWQKALEGGADRSSYFVGLGGGVTTDVTGFAAAAWLRGVGWFAVPTTLLAMVDAAVGGKTGVDFGQAKNALGAFWQPRRVVCDTRYLETEPQRGYVSALAEVVKTALIGDAELLALLERERDAVLRRDRELTAAIVRRCLRVKARIVSVDQREAGLRAALNLGHTVGHALEACAGFGRLAHGEAVSLGLVAALGLGVQCGIMERALLERVSNLLHALGLPTDLRAEPLARALELIGLDKKRRGKSLKFVFVEAPGRVRFETIELDELKRLLALA